jgi:hypothetical protein
MAEHPVARSAMPLSVGFLFLGVGWLTSWIWPDGRVVPAMAVAFGLVAAAVGVYPVDDVGDRAARSLIERR